MSNIIIVASYDPVGGYPVAATYRFYTAVGTAGIQHMILVDKTLDTQLSIFSGANSNPMAVALVDASGTRTTVFSITGAVSFASSLFVGQMGSWNVIIPSLGVFQNGSWQVAVTQQTSPWIVQIASSALNIQPVTGTLAVTQATSPWVVTLGQSMTVFQGNAPWPTQQASTGWTQPVTGTLSVQPHSVGAVQQGSWLVLATQQNTPWIVQQASTGWTTPVTGTIAVTQQTTPWVVHVSCLAGAGLSPTSVFAIQQGSWKIDVGNTIPVTGTIAVTQQTSPWVVLIGSTGTTLAVAAHSVNAVQQGSWTVDARVTQQSTPWLVQQTSTGWTTPVTGTVAVTQATSPFIVQVSCIQGAGTSPTSVWAIQQGSWQVEARITQVTSPLIVQVSCIQGAGTSPTSVWAIQQGSWFVFVTQQSTPWIVQQTSTGWTTPITGTIAVTQQTTPWVVHVSCLAGAGLSPTSVFAIQQGSWKIDIGNTVPVTGTLAVTQQTSPWVVLQGSTGWTIPVTGTLTVLPHSVGAVQQGSWTVDARVTQQSTPWLVQQTSTGWTTPVTGTLAVTQQTTPWVVHVSCLAGGGLAPTSVFAIQQGSWKIDVGNTIAVSVGNTVPVTGTLAVTQANSPWVSTILSLSVFQSGVWSAVVQGGVAHDAVYQGNPIGLGAKAFDLTQTSLSLVDCGDMVGLIADRMGRLRIFIDSGNALNVLPHSVNAVQQGSWTIDARVTQQSTPWLVQQTSTGWTTPVTGTLAVTQATSPWVVLIGSTGASIGVTSVFAIQQGSWKVDVGNTIAVTGTLAVTQTTSPWVATIPSLSVFQSGVWSAVVQGGIAHDAVYQGNPIGLGAKAFDLIQTSLSLVDCGDMVGLIADRMGRLRVFVDSNNALSILPHSVGAVQQGSWTVDARVTQQSTPWLVQQTSTGWTTPVTGTMAVTQATSPWVVLIGSTGVTIGVTSVYAIQQGSWQVNAQVTQQSTPWLVQQTSTGFTTAVTGTLAVTQVTSPWVTTIPSLAVLQSGVWSAVVQGGIAHDAVYQGNPIGLGAKAFDLSQTSLSLVDCGDMVGLIADRMGRLRIFIDSSNTLNVSPISVAAVQQGSWQIAVTQTSSPWVVQQASTGWTTPVTGTVGITGTLTVAAHSVNAVQQGSWQIDARVTQQSTPWLVQQTSTGWTTPVTGTIAVTQTTSPWVVLIGSTGASVGVTSVFAIQQGSWLVLATQQNTPWIVQQASTGFTTAVTGTLAVTQTTSPWVVLIGSTGASVGVTSVFAIQQGSWQVQVSQTNSPWATREYYPTFTLAKIAWEVTSSLAFPYDGGGQCRSSGVGQICLSTTGHSSDITGLAVMIVSSGATMGQVRGITGWAFQQSYEANISPNWDTVGPSSGVKYTLLIDVRNAKSVQFRTEVNSMAGRVYAALGLYANVQTGNIGSVSSLFPANVPVPAFDGLVTIDAIPSSLGITVASFWPAENVGRECRGYVGAKMFVMSYTAKFSMWGAAC